jgi:hypothetical protein
MPSPDFTITSQGNYLEISLDGFVLRDCPKRLMRVLPVGDSIVMEENKKGRKPRFTISIPFNKCSEPSEASAILLSEAVNDLINS